MSVSLSSSNRPTRSTTPKPRLSKSASRAAMCFSRPAHKPPGTGKSTRPCRSKRTIPFRKCNIHSLIIFFSQDDDFELLKFLENVYPITEEALQSNETIDIYQDDFDVLPQSDQQDTTDLSNIIKEIKSFSYLNCKGKKIC